MTLRKTWRERALAAEKKLKDLEDRTQEDINRLLRRYPEYKDA